MPHERLLCLLALCILPAIVAANMNQWTIGIVISNNIIPSMAQSMNQSAQLAIRNINNDNTILPGITLNYVYMNPNTAQDQVVATGIALGTTPGVVGIIGEFFSSVTEPLALVSRAFNITQCSPTATDPTLSDKTTYSTFFRTVPPDNYQAPAIASYIYGMGWRNVVLVYSDDAYGTGLQNAFTTFAPTIGLNVPLSLQYHTPASAPSDFASSLSSIRQRGYRIIAFLGYDTDLLLFMRQARAYNMIDSSYMYLCSDGCSSLLTTVSNPGYTAADQANIDGVNLFGATESANTALSSSYLSQFNSLYGGAPGPNSMFCYDCVYAIAHAFNNLLVNNLTTVSAIYNRQAPITPLSQFLIPFTGITGLVNFTNGDRIDTYAVTNIRYQSNALSSTIIGTVQENLVFQSQSTQYFYGGSTTVPADDIGLPEVVVAYNSGGPIVLVILYVIGLLITLGSACALIVNRGSRAVQRTSLLYYLFVALGLSISWISIFGFTGRVSVTTCAIQQKILWIAFSVYAGAVLARSYWAWRNFENRRLQQIPIKSMPMICSIIILIVTNIIILASWSQSDAPVPTTITTDTNWYLECHSTSSSTELRYATVLLVINGIILLFITWFNGLSSSVTCEYMESEWTDYANKFIIICAIIVIIILYGTSGTLLSNYYVRMLVVFMANALTLYCTLFRIAYLSFAQEDDGQGRHSIVASTARPGTSASNKKKAGVGKSFDIVIKQKGFFNVWVRRNLVVLAQEQAICLFPPADNMESDETLGMCCEFEDFWIEDSTEPDCFRLAIDGIMYMVQARDLQNKLAIMELLYNRNENEAAGDAKPPMQT
ncbi:periplasmic binding protein-like I [Polychytrium aggregatum]|uniref:periplasmic binding protein-like I n=1 Tax=Polychytrium aggregatum TaxID=110093 RepID=UPI0022FE152C|nr:periplasmic binding protein-like I [Polychytrium aggregatum]KAI9203260.1 periplasmic binding protein-like I [Polychytrium aggregatum]